MLVQEEVTVLQGNRQVIRIQLVSLSQVLFHQLSLAFLVTDNRGCLGIQLSFIILVNRQPFPRATFKACFGTYAAWSARWLRPGRQTRTGHHPQSVRSVLFRCVQLAEREFR